MYFSWWIYSLLVLVSGRFISWTSPPRPESGPVRGQCPSTTPHSTKRFKISLCDNPLSKEASLSAFHAAMLRRLLTFLVRSSRRSGRPSSSSRMISCSMLSGFFSTELMSGVTCRLRLNAVTMMSLFLFYVLENVL